MDLVTTLMMQFKVSKPKAQRRKTILGGIEVN